MTNLKPVSGKNSLSKADLKPITNQSFWISLVVVVITAIYNHFVSFSPEVVETATEAINQTTSSEGDPATVGSISIGAIAAIISIFVNIIRVWRTDYTDNPDPMLCKK